MLKCASSPLYVSPVSELKLCGDKSIEGMQECLSYLIRTDNPSRILEMIKDKALADFVTPNFHLFFNSSIKVETILSTYDTTLLIWSVKKGYQDLSREIIARLSPDYLAVADDKGRSALVMAIENARLDIIPDLIKAMTARDLGTVAPEGLTPLMMILMRQPHHADIANLLIDKMLFGDLQKRNPKNRTTLMIAIENGWSKIVRRLADSVDPDSLADKDDKGNNFLFYAAELMSVEDFAYLVVKMPVEKLGDKNNKGETVLIYAARNGNSKNLKCEILLRRMTPEQVAYQNNKGNTCRDIISYYAGDARHSGRYNSEKLWNANLQMIDRRLRGEPADLPEVVKQEIVVSEPEAAPVSSREIIEKAIVSGNASDATDVGHVIFDACAAFAGDVRKNAAESFAAGVEAAQELNSLSQQSLQLQEDYNNLLNPPPEPSPWQKFLSIMGWRKIPVPLEQFDRSRRHILESSNEALGKSKITMQRFESFQRRYPQIRASLSDLRADLSEGIEFINRILEEEKDTLKQTSALRVKKHFSAASQDAEDILQSVEFLMSATDRILDTESDFAINIGRVRKAFTLSEINATHFLQMLKEKANETMLADVEPMLKMQFAAAAQLKSLADERRQRLIEYATLPDMPLEVKGTETVLEPA